MARRRPPRAGDGPGARARRRHRLLRGGGSTDYALAFGESQYLVYDLVVVAFDAVPIWAPLRAGVYLVTPFHVGDAGYIDVRLAPMLALFVLPLLRPEQDRERVEREMLGDFDGLLATMKPSTRLAMLNFAQRSPGSGESLTDAPSPAAMRWLIGALGLVTSV